MSNERIEKVYVLYGSQTGNSEQAALDVCAKAPEKLSPQVIQKRTGTPEQIVVQMKAMPLDDFLEMDHAQWTRLVVIITSSYGLGQAPLGCYRFRELCDEWVSRLSSSQQGNCATSMRPLEGIQFALLGLGDSKYTTFFHNPTKIDQALRLAGAQRIGPLGKADASGTGDDEQLKVIERWIDDVWDHLARAVMEPPLSGERLQQIQQATVDVCRKINPDYLPSKGNSSTNASLDWLLPAVGILAAVMLYFLIRYSP